MTTIKLVNHRATTTLLGEVRACTLCAASLPEGPRPVLQVHGHARIL
ncbi:MAG: uracil-DNA glycosylase family protein, partial [Burkholderiales bacterium]|nr:uracil-DNA glycosylase family protein [Burkholderiales bacterium]